MKAGTFGALRGKSEWLNEAAACIFFLPGFCGEAV